MYLEKLNIFGFKSFARKTSFTFPYGIITIVGPNGCGKSNIVDAIRWVLGEQKAGILRSDRMENVIFNGTKEMKPMGMAEVSLTIKNTKNILQVEYSEVLITRRLFRSGESQYLLNNSICRLKDITDLLMDTGMASDAYSVIELSMVESILSGKPEERRRIFEEAAGITKYKQRRRITFRKLETTENDLVRLKDIINEVELKVKSLRRQVKRAQHYQTLTQQLKETEIRTATHKYSKIYEELIPLKEQLEQKIQEREINTTQISFKEAETESLKTELIQVEQNLRNSQVELNKIHDSIRKKEEEILVGRERLKSLSNDNIRLQTEIEQLQKRIHEHHKILDKLTLDLEEVNKKIDIEDKNYIENKKTLEESDRQLQHKREEGKHTEHEILRLVDQLSEKQRNIEHQKATLQHLQNRLTELQTERTTRSERIISYEKQLQSLEKSEKEKVNQVDKLHTQQYELTPQLEKLSTDIDIIKEEIVKDYGQIDTLQHRIAILDKLLENYADYPEGVQYLMKESDAFMATLANVISVEDKYRQAIETALGEAATYVIVSNSEQAFLGIKFLQEIKKGVITFLPLNNFSNDLPHRPSVNLPFSTDQIIGWADEIIQCESTYRPLLNTLLRDYLVVSESSIVDSNPQFVSSNSVHIVTLSGEMITSWGGIKGGKKPLDDTGFIGRRDQLKGFQKKINEIQVKIQQAEEKKHRLGQVRETIIKKEEEIKTVIIRLEKELAEIRLAISQVKYEHNQSEEFIQKVTQEINSLNQKIMVTQQNVENNTNELEQLSQVRLTKEENISIFEKNLDSLIVRREELSQNVHQLKLNLVQFKNKIQQFQTELTRSKQIISESENFITNKNNELVENKKSYEQLTDRINELTSLLATDYTRKEELEKVVVSIEQQLLSLRDNVEQKEKLLRQLRSMREVSSEEIHQRELRIAELNLNADNLFRQIAEEYNLDLKKEPVDESYDLQADEQAIERLKQRIKALGLVNLLALNEYESEKNRFDFLNKQHDDLIEAQQNLNDTIKHINKTAREKFIEIFQKIRINFNKVFQQFFEDGEADLIYSENEDPLEANIEIVANPKGKRPTSLMLLSGGEKALTAISLLFAIYLVKPSPFCILDEVDAPLDDTNIQRFSNALRKFSNDTQFIIVTHNKLTMKASDCLYGITMDGSGVSKVVSVKIE